VASGYADSIPTLVFLVERYRKNYDRGVTAREFEKRKGFIAPERGIACSGCFIQALPEDAVQHAQGLCAYMIYRNF
jgi:hypothetical protein